MWKAKVWQDGDRILWMPTACPPGSGIKDMGPREWKPGNTLGIMEVSPDSSPLDQAITEFRALGWKVNEVAP